MRTPPYSSLLLALPLVACGGGGPGTAERQTPNWNVLLVTLDTTRPDWLGCYGGAGETPHIDRVAAEGARFERCQSTAGITPMSHASILTGLNNYAHGMRVFHSDEISHTLKEDVDSLPEILKERRGYATAAMLSAYVVSEIYNLQQGFDTFLHGVDLTQITAEKQSRHEVFFERETGKTRTQRRSDHTVDDALGWLEEQESRDQAWCMWMHLFDVHDYTILPPDEYAQERGIQFPAAASRAPKGHKLREELYGPELSYMDQQLGRVLDWLRDNGKYEETVVVITADHGQGLLDGLERHGWAKHRLLYDWSIRVPLIIKVPGETSQTVVSDLVRTIDIVPTILEALQVGTAQEMHGASVLGLMQGQVDESPRMAYADALNLFDAHAPARGKLPPGHDDNMYCLNDGTWKLVWRVQDTTQGELFNLDEDPEELRNLFIEDHPQVQRLKAQLDAQGAFHLDPPSDSNAAAVDPDMLRGLGYGGGEDEAAPPDPEDEDRR
jgi:arylsulfatase A-like enzyme